MSNVATARATPPGQDSARKPEYVRRFELPDLTEHGSWLMPRLLRAFPHISARNMAGFLNGQLYSSEMSFMYSKNAVGMAQIVRSATLQPKPIVWERFLFCRDPKDDEHHAEGLAIYEHWVTWAKHQGGDTVIVLQQSDVPAEMLGKAVSRLNRVEQFFLKV